MASQYEKETLLEAMAVFADGVKSGDYKVAGFDDYIKETLPPMELRWQRWCYLNVLDKLYGGSWLKIVRSIPQPRLRKYPLKHIQEDLVVMASLAPKAPNPISARIVLGQDLRALPGPKSDDQIEAMLLIGDQYGRVLMFGGRSWAKPFLAHEFLKSLFSDDTERWDHGLWRLKYLFCHSSGSEQAQGKQVLSDLWAGSWGGRPEWATD